MDIGQGLASFGQSIAGAMDDYHKKHVAYDEQFQLAQALSRIGMSPDGQLTMIDPNAKDKSIKPVIDPSVVQTFVANNAQQRAKLQGSMEATNRIAMNLLQHAAISQMQTQTPLGREQLKAAQLANQRIPTQVGDKTLDLTPAGAATAGFEQQRIDIAKQPKGLTPMQQFRMQEAKDKAFQQKIQSSPEFSFTKKYSVQPQQVLRPDVLDPKKQAYRFFTLDSNNNPTEVQPEYDDYGIPRRPSYLKGDVTAYWTPATDIFRENKIERNKDGVKTTQYAPDPTGELVNIGGQRIPFNDIQAINTRHDELLKQAQVALKQGADPQALAKQWVALGYNVQELLGK